MIVERVDVIVEEPSMEAAMRVLLPRILHGVSFSVYQHQCKSGLLARLPARLEGYASWLPETWRIMVLIDRDDADCRKLKAQLEQMARQAGLRTRSQARGHARSQAQNQYSVVNRVVVEELEAWFFGDWEAVRKAYPRINATVPAQAKYRDPDAIKGGTWEALERLLQAAGYFKSGLRKIELARAIAEHMEPERNTSRSFRAFHLALREMISASSAS